MFDCYCIPMNTLPQDTKLSPMEVFVTVCRYYALCPTLVASKSRKDYLVKARHVYCYLAYLHTNQNLKSIGELVGARDHTTIIHARDKVKVALTGLDVWSLCIAKDVEFLEDMITKPYFKVA